MSLVTAEEGLVIVVSVVVLVTVTVEMFLLAQLLASHDAIVQLGRLDDDGD